MLKLNKKFYIIILISTFFTKAFSSNYNTPAYIEECSAERQKVIAAGCISRQGKRYDSRKTLLSYFVTSENYIIKCAQCDQVYKGNNTRVLGSHLKKHHPAVFDEICSKHPQVQKDYKEALARSQIVRNRKKEEEKQERLLDSLNARLKSTKAIIRFDEGLLAQNLTAKEKNILTAKIIKLTAKKDQLTEKIAKLTKYF